MSPLEGGTAGRIRRGGSAVGPSPHWRRVETRFPAPKEVRNVKVKVVGFIGSPRVDGNTDRMVEWVLEAAMEEGAEVECVALREKRIAPCKACETCAKPPHRCATQDDMEDIQALLSQAQGIVLGTPVYWWGPSAQMKAFVDRWYGFRGDHRGTVRGKKFGLVVALGDSDVSTARHVVGMFKDALNYLDCDLHEPVLAPGCASPDDVERMPQVRTKCRELGKWLAST